MVTSSSTTITLAMPRFRIFGTRCQAWSSAVRCVWRSFGYSARVKIYDHPTFHMACQQFDLVADYLQIPENDRARLKYPKRSISVALPIHCDDGSTRVFT